MCRTCQVMRTGVVRGIVNWDGGDGSGSMREPPCEYALVACDVCGDAALQIREDLGDPDDVEPFTIWPVPRMLGGAVPDPVRRDFTEATVCFDAGAYTASVVMVRRTLEGLCAAHGIGERTLARGLTEMHARSLIDDTLAEWSAALRLIGNRGAHHGEHLDRQAAEDALHFAEALLNHVYVLRARFDEFQARLAGQGH